MLKELMQSGHQTRGQRHSEGVTGSGSPHRGYEFVNGGECHVAGANVLLFLPFVFFFLLT